MGLPIDTLNIVCLSPSATRFAPKPRTTSVGGVMP